MMTRTERDKMLAGDLYDAGAPELQGDAAAAHEWLARYNAAFGTPISERWELLLERLAAVGEGAVIRPPFHCDYGFNISLGAGGRADSDFGRADLGTRCCHRGAGHGRDRAARGGADDLHHRPSAVDSAALRPHRGVARRRHRRRGDVARTAAPGRRLCAVLSHPIRARSRTRRFVVKGGEGTANA